MKKLLYTICLLLIGGCIQTSSPSSVDWPENWNYMEATSGDELPSPEREESLLPDTGPTAEEIKDWSDKPNPIKIIEVGPSAGYSYVTPGIPYNLTKQGRHQSHLTELQKLHQWIQDSLVSGAIHSVNVEYNEVRMDPIPWSSVPIESKRIIIQCFSRYFDLKGSTGRVTIRSKYSDEKLASYSVWTGIKIYK